MTIKIAEYTILMNSLTSRALHLTLNSVPFEEDFKKIMWCKSDQEHKGIYTLLRQSELQKTKHYEGKRAHVSFDCMDTDEQEGSW